MDKIIDSLSRLPDFFWDVLLILIAWVIGFLAKLILQMLLRQFVKNNGSFSLWTSILTRLGRPFIYFLSLTALHIFLPVFRGNQKVISVIDKSADIAMIISIATILIGIVGVAQDYVYHAYDIHTANNLRARKIRTQLQFLRRVAIVIIILMALCFILLSFESLRRLGTGLLTGVGIGGVIIGFAAQKSLGNLLAGFQIAFTQPIRIDDVLIVENEWGRVEEITLTYVVIRLWDQRSLIVPINYFIEKPFQNWTRTGSSITGSVFIYTDYTIPIEPLRTEFSRLLKTTPLWDGQISALQITNTTDRAIEVRMIMSSNDSSNAFDLRCYIRECMVNFIQQNYPASLPVARAIIQGK